jgi:manganese/zinc/iron transport system permease protein
MGAERVHRNAEEMEHIITPELEQELIELLNNPMRDPHSQPIPPSQKRKPHALP